MQSVNNLIFLIRYFLSFVTRVFSLAVFLAFPLPILAFAADPADRLEWRDLPALPQALGGQFAGVSNGALLAVGGSGFEVSIFEGGQKKWHDSIYVLEPGASGWHLAGRLDRPLAYGGSVTVTDGLICIGGSSSERHFADVFRLSRASSGELEKTQAAGFVTRKSSFGALNYFVLIGYLGVNLLIGAILVRRQRDTNDYFRGGQRIPWWAAGIAIFGTQLPV